MVDVHLQHVLPLALEVDREKAKTNSEIAERLQRFDNDDRLLKSLLLSALVHGVESLKNMTAMRLAALNHGTIRSRIPGREHQVVTDKLRTWAGIVDVTPDASPILGLSPIENLFLNCGWGTGGFKATPAAGWVYAHTIAHGSPHPLNSPFTLERFTTGALIDEHGAAAVAH